MASIHEYADKIMIEIDKDITAGILPANVSTFVELHDHVDANEYITDAGHYWDNTDENIAFVNAVESEVNRRLSERSKRN